MGSIHGSLSARRWAEVDIGRRCWSTCLDETNEHSKGIGADVEDRMMVTTGGE